MPLSAVCAGIALGRKSWLFAGSDRGGRRAAAMYILIGTAKLNDVDPQAWLADVLGRIAGTPQNRLDELLPWNWIPEQRARSSRISRLTLKTTPIRTHSPCNDSLSTPAVFGGRIRFKSGPHLSTTLRSHRGAAGWRLSYRSIIGTTKLLS